MFLGYYKATNVVNDDCGVLCVLGRTSLTALNKEVGIKNTLLVETIEGNFIEEGSRLLTLCQNQNLIQISTSIDPDIEIMSRTLISQIKDYKLNNPFNKSALLLNIKRYTKDFMYYLDWEDRYESILNVDPTLVGKTYIEYKTTEGQTKRTQAGTFELVT